MHRIFGINEGVEYVHRKGAYLIPVKNDCIGVVQTPKGYFLPGGGIDNGETDALCIRRECMEETGYFALIKKKICSAESYVRHPVIGYFHPIQTYYLGELVGPKQAPIESAINLYGWIMIASGAGCFWKCKIGLWSKAITV